MFYNKNKFRNDKYNRSCPRGTQPYSINTGDTLYSIAKKFGTTISQIIFLNPFIQPYHLMIGQVICVPNDACSDGTFYTIQPGDTLYSISKKQGVTVEAIMDVNLKLDPYNLMPGRMICIPTKQNTKKCPKDTTLYVVKPNDTLTKLLVKYDYSYSTMLHYNPGVDFTNLTPGTKLCVPKKDTLSIGYCPTGKTYVTQDNDTVINIAENFVVATDDLMIYNPYLKPSDFETPNMKICIPPEVEV